MNNSICTIWRYSKFDASFLHRRFVFDVKETIHMQEAPGGKEKKEYSSEDVQKAKQAFDGEKKAFESKLDEYLKSENPAIKKAAEQAKEDLKRFNESDILSPEAIKNQLNYIQGTLKYFEGRPTLEKNSKKIEALAKETHGQWVDAIQKMVDEYVKEHPNLPKEQMDVIKSMVADYAERMDGTVSIAVITGTKDSDLSLEDYLMNPDRMRVALEANQLGFDLFKMEAKEPWLVNSLNDLYDEMRQRCEAQLCIGYSKDQKAATDYINGYHAQAVDLLRQWGEKQKKDVSDKMAGLDYIFGNALASINSLNKSGDAAQRALVLANIQDQIDLLYTGKTREKDPQAITDQTTLVEQTMKQLKLPADKYQDAFAKGSLEPSDPRLKLDEKVQQTDVVYKTTGTPNFRLEGSGARIMTLPPGTVVRILDSNVMAVDTNDGKKVHYVRVQLDPPNGPVGFIGQNHVNYQKPEIDLYLAGSSDKGPEKSEPVPLKVLNPKPVGIYEVQTELPNAPKKNKT